jgi:hypothetical protein
LRRAKDREAIHFATVNQLTQYQAGLNGLSNSDVISNHQPHSGKAEGHEQWDQLIGAGLEGHPRSRTEWSRTAAQRKPQGFRKKATSILGCQVLQFR